jgi:guanylate kinase
MREAPRRGLVFVLSGPSGVGKTTLMSLLRHREPAVHFCITATTRPPREGERNGVDYIFLSEAAFHELRTSGGLLEYANIPPGSEKFYGIPCSEVSEPLRRGEDVFAAVDVQGAASLRTAVPNAVLIFLMPPDEAALLRRLRGRNTENQADLDARLANAEVEMARREEFDYWVVNPDDELDRAADDIAAILRAERLRARPRYGELQPAWRG